MAVPEHRRLQHEAVRTEARAQRSLFAGDCAQAQDEFSAAIELYKQSYEIAPPGATGRLIGLLKASVIGATAELESVAYAKRHLRHEDDDPPRAYAFAICRLIDGADEGLPEYVDAMRPGSPPFGRAATAIEALGRRSAKSYADAVAAIVHDFEGRRHHVTKVPIADTALMLEIFARRRGIAAHPSSPLLPAPCPGGAQGHA
ncbi:MAG: hypothetical protein J0H06_13990 [Actinobacteria bacterium]|nr:hypothetical protein [Actinomycetota bacterium]OJU86023.1 MAG: hypothetical protein BGO11_08365 [Solirubrobacterales bacterium 70-9]